MEKRTNSIEITIYTNSRDVNNYVATYINQQLRGNINYINNAIIVNTDSTNQDTKTIIYLYPDDMDKNNIPNIAIDWNGIERIKISNLDNATKNRIAKSIEECCYQYPNIDNFDMLINDLHPNQLIVVGNEPHIVFNLHDWIINNNEENKKEN